MFLVMGDDAAGRCVLDVNHSIQRAQNTQEDAVLFSF